MSKPQFSRKRGGKKVDPYPMGAKSKTTGSKKTGRPSKGRPRNPSKPKIEDSQAAADFLAVYYGSLADQDWDDIEEYSSEEFFLYARMVEGQLTERQKKQASKWAADYMEDLEPSTPKDPYVRLVGVYYLMEDGDYTWDDLEYEVPEALEGAAKRVEKRASKQTIERARALNAERGREGTDSSYSLGDRVLVLGTWYTVDDIAESGTLELVDEDTMDILFLEESQFHNIEEHERGVG